MCYLYEGVCKNKVAILIIFSILSFFYVQSQKLKFDRFNVEAGLQNNIVFQATQDSKGLMWFATMTGIDRFDGNKFIHYPLPLRSGGFSSYSQVPFILSDANKQVWAASTNSVFFYDIQKDVFVLQSAINSQLEKNRTITSFASGNGNRQLFIGSNNGFFIYNQADQKITNVNKFNQLVRCFFQDSKGLIWVGTNKGIHRFVINGVSANELINDLPALDVLNEIPVSIISQDEYGRYWIASPDKGIFVYDEIKNDLQQVRLPGTTLRTFTVKDIFHIKGKDYSFVSTDGGGLIVVDRNLNISGIYQTNEDDITSLSNNAAYDIYSDIYNRIWITTYGGGVNTIMPEVQPFRNIQHEMNNVNSLKNNAAKAIAEDVNGNLWFGTRNGISKLNLNTNKWIHISQDVFPNKIISDNILSLYSHGNNLWAGTYGGGILHTNVQGRILGSYLFNADDSGTIGTDYVYALLFDSKQRLWAGGIRGHLSYLDPVKNKFYRIRSSISAVNCIIEDSQGDILIGSEKGIYKVNGDTLYHLFTQNISDRVVSITEESPGELWIGTFGNGLFLLSKTKGILEHYKTDKGLPSDVICGLVKDNDKNLWVGTSRGIAHIQRKEKKVTSFSKADGLAGSQINFGAVYKTREGSIVVGTTDGFSIFNPKQIAVKGFQPSIVFTGLTINNKKITPQDPDSLISKQLDELAELKLKYYQNSFSIDFINASPAVSGKHLYSWKLLGFDKEWSQPSTVPSAIYTNLGSGKYTLVIRTFSKSGEEISYERRMPIIIKAPWWFSGWAFLGYFLLLLGGASVAYKFLQERNARKKFAERLRLNTKISHEIRTPLTLIKGPVNALANAENISEEQRQNIQLAQKNIQKLEGIVSQFIDYQKMGATKMQMQVKEDDILLLLDDVTESFAPLMKEKNIHFTYRRPTEKIKLLFDHDKMEKVLNNLVSNAVKYTPAKKDISISAEKNGNYLNIMVEDTGVGIPLHQQHLVFSGYFRADNTVNIKVTGSGIGLTVARELIEMHHGKLSFKSSMGKGSLFTVSLPLVNDRLKEFLIAQEDLAAEIPEIGPVTLNNLEKKKILIAEDNDELRLYLEKELTATGLKVFAATDGLEGLKIVKKNKIDIVITDVMMPEMNGFQLCGAIKRDITTCHIPVIMLTAIHDRDYLLEGYRNGADDYVKKPFDLAYILTRIDNLLANRLRFRNKLMSVFEQSDEGLQNDEDILWLKNATEIIAENLDDNEFTVEKFCRLMGVSRPVLFRKFKSITNEAPQHYIMQLRLRKAVELIKQKKYNINEVAFMTGFSDPKYFSTAFKKHFGKSPKEYSQEEN